MKQLRKNSRKALAAIMSVWLSGVVFLFCSMPMTASASGHCPLAKPGSGHCNKSRSHTNSELISDTSSQALDCCGFMPAVFDKNRKIEREIQASEPASRAALSSLRFEPISERRTETKFYTSFRILQKKIFIKNRVFRI